MSAASFCKMATSALSSLIENRYVFLARIIISGSLIFFVQLPGH